MIWTVGGTNTACLWQSPVTPTQRDCIATILKPACRSRQGWSHAVVKRNPPCCSLVIQILGFRLHRLLCDRQDWHTSGPVLLLHANNSSPCQLVIVKFDFSSCCCENGVIFTLHSMVMLSPACDLRGSTSAIIPSRALSIYAPASKDTLCTTGGGDTMWGWEVAEELRLGCCSFSKRMS